MRILICLLLFAASLQAEVIEIYNPISKDSEPSLVECGRRKKAIIYLHGWTQTYRSYDSYVKNKARDLGWSFLAPNVRDDRVLFGKQYRNALEDIRQNVKVARRRCKATQIFLFGRSGGGLMAFNYMRNASYAATIDKLYTTGGVTDLEGWRNYAVWARPNSNFHTDVDILCRTKRRCRKLSPTKNSVQVSIPTLIHHNSNDTTVPYWQGQNLADKLGVRIISGNAGHDSNPQAGLRFFRRRHN